MLFGVRSVFFRLTAWVPPAYCQPAAALAQACIDVVPKNAANFNVDNVRVVKILGGGAHDSKVVKGVVIKRSTEGAIQDVADAKVAVFAQGVDTASTETKVQLILSAWHHLVASLISLCIMPSHQGTDARWPCQVGGTPHALQSCPQHFCMTAILNRLACEVTCDWLRCSTAGDCTTMLRWVPCS